MHNWNHFMEGGGDSTMDLIEGLNDAFISRLREQEVVKIASFIDMEEVCHEQQVKERPQTTINQREVLGV